MADLPVMLQEPHILRIMRHLTKTLTAHIPYPP